MSVVQAVNYSSGQQEFVRERRANPKLVFHQDEDKLNKQKPFSIVAHVSLLPQDFELDRNGHFATKPFNNQTELSATEVVSREGG